MHYMHMSLNKVEFIFNNLSDGKFIQKSTLFFITYKDR